MMPKANLRLQNLTNLTTLYHCATVEAGDVLSLAMSQASVRKLATEHQMSSNSVLDNDKPTAAQAAAGRLQRASARQAAKAAQQQKRHAHSTPRTSVKRSIEYNINHVETF